MDKDIMLFHSLEFAIFLIIVFFVYWAVPQRLRSFVLLVSSLYFYMQWNVKYVTLILLAIGISYLSALGIGRAREKGQGKGREKFFFLMGILGCILLLFFFKYFNFLSESITALIRMVDPSAKDILLDVLLPVGITFYTFQTMGYVIDVYRGDIKAEKDLVLYAAYISFFPQLVAGPIERSTNLLPQMRAEKQFSYEEAAYGMRLMAWGYFKKLLIADAMAVYMDRVYNNIQGHAGLDLILVGVIFPIRIYCDFSAYSDIATGCARLFGIRLMKNFDCPFFSKTTTELWRRWHISLSSWFRDYVYIPLGGSRRGAFRKWLNILIVFALSGLWHGAAWHFVVWGLIEGVVQVVEAVFAKPVKKLTSSKAGGVIGLIVTNFFFMVSGVFFCVRSMPDGAYYFSHCLDGIGTKDFFRNTIQLYPLPAAVILGSIALLTVYDAMSLRRDMPEWIGKQPKALRYAMYAGILLLLMLLRTTGKTEFVYFQF
ncbi:MAG: MBOAT family protein [Lachnospiraceae bacterium]|nr:MBOAT family protein [Lachnospiraceae bacterium]